MTTTSEAQVTDASRLILRSDECSFTIDLDAEPNPQEGYSAIEHDLEQGSVIVSPSGIKGVTYRSAHRHYPGKTYREIREELRKAGERPAGANLIDSILMSGNVYKTPRERLKFQNNVLAHYVCLGTVYEGGWVRCLGCPNDVWISEQVFLDETPTPVDYLVLLKPPLA